MAKIFIVEIREKQAEGRVWAERGWQTKPREERGEGEERGTADQETAVVKMAELRRDQGWGKGSGSPAPGGEV